MCINGDGGGRIFSDRIDLLSASYCVHGPVYIGPWFRQPRLTVPLGHTAFSLFKLRVDKAQFFFFFFPH